MKEKRYVRVDPAGQSLVVTPLFTFATFAEGDKTTPSGSAGEWQELQTQLEDPSIRNVLVDLGEIPYFGSTVLEWMVQMWRRMKAREGRLAVCNCSPIGREVLMAARFDKLWSIFPTRDEALASLTPEGGQTASS
jgi:anti-anti-sigma factor